ncbi:ABC-type sugar transport system permease subunit [Bacillus sp. 3255]|nr:ABC-type sugar transport system permease subunit [Bacillus sp. 3255]
MKGFKRGRAGKGQLYLMLLPNLVLFAGLTVYPILWSLRLSVPMNT